MIRGRLRRRRGNGEQTAAEGGEAVGDEFFEIDPAELTGLFSAPRWLRDAGLTAWLLVGITVLLVGIVWLLSLTSVIALPVATAGIIAAVASPLVRWMASHHLPRGLGAGVVLLAIVAVGAFAGFLILDGIASETSSITNHLQDAASKIEGWLKDLGVSDGKASKANADASAGASDSFHALLSGVASTVERLTSLVFFLAMTVLSLFFLLKDGPTIRTWVERHMGVPSEVATSVSNRTLQSLRGYFVGVTIVAAFSAILVGGSALVIGIPLAGTIAVVTFFGGYVPYLGAWTAGAFAVLLALGGAGPEAAAAMVVIQLLSNGPLQQIVQPIAYGAALGLHPLAVLIVTIAGGALFGAIGLVLAAPLTSAVVRISGDLSKTKAPAAAAAPAAAT